MVFLIARVEERVRRHVIWRTELRMKAAAIIAIAYMAWNFVDSTDVSIEKP